MEPYDDHLAKVRSKSSYKLMLILSKWLKWNMRAAKAQISMRGNRVFKFLHSPIMTIVAFLIQ